VSWVGSLFSRGASSFLFSPGNLTVALCRIKQNTRKGSASLQQKGLPKGGSQMKGGKEETVSDVPLLN
jgi:hypothetical protein